MADPEYEYHGLMAQTWDLFRGDTSTWEDRPFYLEVIRESGEPVLDIGCGTGRLLLDYLSFGMDVDGLDNSPEMIDLCKEKARAMGLTPRLFEGSMEAMNLPRHYKTIIIPSSSFQLITDPNSAIMAMERLFNHLVPGGKLVMSFMQVWERGRPYERSWHISGEKVRPRDGATVRRWSYSRFDPATQLEHTEDRYEVIMDGEIIASEHHLHSPATREYTQQQTRELVRNAGFVEISLNKGFTRLPAADNDEVFTVIGKKPI